MAGNSPLLTDRDGLAGKRLLQGRHPDIGDENVATMDSNGIVQANRWVQPISKRCRLSKAHSNRPYAM